jgi:hypothetical protein
LFATLDRLAWVRAFEGGEEVVEGAAGDVELSAWEFLAPSLFEFGDGLSGGVEDLAAFAGWEDQLCSAVGGVGSPFEVAEVLEFVDEFRASGQAELRFGGEVGQPDAVDADVAPHLEVGEADVEELAVGLCVGEELGPEVVEQPAKELADGESIVWESS